jgi:hypothetical protein
VIFNYLGGELTLKAFLKGLTILIIAGAIFSYYLYDIKRDKLQGEKDSVIKMFGYGSLAAVVIVFIASFFFVESPAVARSMRLDAEVVDKMSQIENAAQMYYNTEGKLPESLPALIEGNNFIQADALHNHVAKKEFEYSIIEDKKYELCTEFLRSNLNDDYGPYGYIDTRWLHDAGRDCVTRTVGDYNNNMEKPLPVERF